ncbi:hypothetical protein UY3_10183 [Chelonia mydas]|uniref:Uncharacterized protein n=1 Tax=Chelonia mydas TaxID=8469 RepID=M7BKX6_CHEMY|nr:hypothetical protein UY3_10183 [Chelonia mydas]
MVDEEMELEEDGRQATWMCSGMVNQDLFLTLDGASQSQLSSASDAGEGSSGKASMSLSPRRFQRLPLAEQEKHGQWEPRSAEPADTAVGSQQVGISGGESRGAQRAHHSPTLHAGSGGI